MNVPVQISSESEDSSVTRLQFPNNTTDSGMVSDALLELAKEKFSQPAHSALPTKNINISFNTDDQIEIKLNSEKIYATYDSIKELLQTMSKMSPKEIKGLSDAHRVKETHDGEFVEAFVDKGRDEAIAPYVAAVTAWMMENPTLYEEFLKIARESSEGEKGPLAELKELMKLAHTQAQARRV